MWAGALTVSRVPLLKSIICILLRSFISSVIWLVNLLHLIMTCLALLCLLLCDKTKSVFSIFCAVIRNYGMEQFSSCCWTLCLLQITLQCRITEWNTLHTSLETFVVLHMSTNQIRNFPTFWHGARTVIGHRVSRTKFTLPANLSMASMHNIRNMYETRCMFRG